MSVSYNCFPSLYAGTITVQDGKSASDTEAIGLYLKYRYKLKMKKPALDSNKAVAMTKKARPNVELSRSILNLSNSLSMAKNRWATANNNTNVTPKTKRICQEMDCLLKVLFCGFTSCSICGEFEFWMAQEASTARIARVALGIFISIFFIGCKGRNSDLTRLAKICANRTLLYRIVLLLKIL